MEKRRILAAVVLTVLLCVMLGTFAEQVSAAGGGTDMMEQKGIEGLFSRKGDKNDPRKPTKAQMWMGVGSILVMIVVVKYL